MAKVAFVEVLKTSKNDGDLRKLQRAINKDLGNYGVRISNLYKTRSGDYGWNFNLTLTKAEISLVEKVIKSNIGKLDKKVVEFGKRVVEVSLKMNRNFKGDFGRFLDSRDARVGGKTPFELLWEDGDRGMKKVIALIEALRCGDFV